MDYLDQKRLTALKQMSEFMMSGGLQDLINENKTAARAINIPEDSEIVQEIISEINELSALRFGGSSPEESITNFSNALRSHYDQLLASKGLTDSDLSLSNRLSTATTVLDDAYDFGSAEAFSSVYNRLFKVGDPELKPLRHTLESITDYIEASHGIRNGIDDRYDVAMNEFIADHGVDQVNIVTNIIEPSTLAMNEPEDLIGFMVDGEGSNTTMEIIRSSDRKVMVDEYFDCACNQSISEFNDDSYYHDAEDFTPPSF